MKKDYTKIIFIVDRSGSMTSIANDVIGGYNKFIADQKALKQGTCDVSFYQFDTLYDTVYENVDINFVKDLDGKTFVPRGGTALLDAVGRTVNSVGEQLSKLKEEDRPEKVMLVILTDGEENSSKEFSSVKINELVTHQRDVYNWQFIYIGANQNAWSTGATLGFGTGSTLTYAANNVGVQNAFMSLSANTSLYRSADKCSSYSFSSEDLDAQKSAGVTDINNLVNAAGGTGLAGITPKADDKKVVKK